MQQSNFVRGRRLRIFAGPNGSGKSTIYNKIDSQYDTGYYINPDNIEKEIKINNNFTIKKFGLENINPNLLNSFLANHSLKHKAESKGFTIDMSLSNDIISINSSTVSYEAALISDFIRDCLIDKGSKLSFETVMSHNSKIKILEKSKNNGYKNYLYFICTGSPQINIDRVKQRVKQGGHDVAVKSIEERYYQTLNLLKSAVENSYRAFIFDNSLKSSDLILEVYQGEDVTFHNSNIPGWVNKYLLSR